MSNNAEKKQAKSLLEKFKKHYEETLEKEDMTKRDSLDKMNSFWIGKLIDKEIKREIVRLIGQESYLLKLIFNQLKAFRGAIPQKLWFLGDAHSLDFLRRTVCNIPNFTFSLVLNGALERSVDFAFNMHVATAAATCFFYLSNQCFKVEVNSTDKNRLIVVRESRNGNFDGNISDPENFLTKEETNGLRLYEPRDSHLWSGDLLVLQEKGEIHWGCKKVDIYLNDKKVENQRILQFDLKQSEVILLFETHFLAMGVVRKSRSGVLIDCQEMGGSYPTGFFAISSDFRLIVRKSVFVENIPRSVAFQDPAKLRTAVELMETLLTPENDRYIKHRPVDALVTARGGLSEEARTRIIGYFCSDSQVVLAAMDNTQFPEEYHLTEKEKLIIATRSRMSDFPVCEHFDGDFCPNVKAFVAFGRAQLDDLEKEGAEEPSDRKKELLHLTTEMLGYMGKSLDSIISTGEVSGEFLHDYQVNQYYYEPRFVNPPFDRLVYHPLDIYEQYFTKAHVHTEVSIATHSMINLEYCEKILLRIVRYRPDLLLFGSTPIHLSVDLLKEFAELASIDNDFTQRKDGINGLIENFANWAISHPHLNIAPENDPNQPSTSSR